MAHKDGIKIGVDKPEKGFAVGWCGY